MMTYFKKIRVLSIAFIFSVIQLAFLFNAIQVSSLTQKDRERLFTPFYDEEVRCELGGGSASADGKLYMIGDSIAESSKNQLEDSFGAKGFKPVIINAKASRTLTPGAGDLNGLSVLETDGSEYSDAKVIVIELGTNSSGLTDSNIKTAVETIKSNNQEATIYWVNVGADNSKRDGGDIDTNALNAIIQRNSNLGYSIIDWSNIVQQNSSYINDDGLGVHLSDEGKTGFAEFIAERVGTGGSSPRSGQACACATALAGADNQEKVWNYLISANGMGFTAIQAAGAMGNLKHEGGFNPKQVEYGHMSGNKWVNGQPFDFPPEMDTIPPSDLAPIVSGLYAGQPGYGIVQWTSPGRKAGLQAMADQKGLFVYDLSVQLDFMKSELEGPYKSAALDPIKATDDLATAVSAWQDHYEVGKGFQPRMDAAVDFLNQYGAGGGGSGGAGGVSGCGGVSNGNWTWPHEDITAPITSCFGGREAPKEGASTNHQGIDISRGPGNKILAAANGTVEFAGLAGGAGLLVKIKHENGTQTQYMHNSKIHVAVGDSVEAGQHISDEGTTGVSTAPHLHFEIIRDGQKINPLDELTVPEGAAIIGNNCTASNTGGQL